MKISDHLENTITMRMIAFILLCLSVLGLSGCGGGGGGSDPGVAVDTTSKSKPTATGVLLDSKVEGITYISGSVSGVTDANGTFRYETGSTVRFVVGGLVIGEAQGKGVITPVDFVKGGDASNPTVLNIVRFLVTIDSDGNPDNGIQITKTMRNLVDGDSINFAQSAANFAANGNVQTIVSQITAATTAGARTLVTDSVAKKHLSNTIWNYYAGSYSGTFSGDDSGSFDVQIMANGMMIGTGTSSSVGTFTVTGQLSTDGSLTFATGGTSTSATFTGKIGTKGALSGTWKNTGQTGKFSGQRLASKTGSNNTSTGNTGGSNTGGNTSSPYGSVTITGYIKTTFTPSTGTGSSIGAYWIGIPTDMKTLIVGLIDGITPGRSISYQKAMTTTYSCKSGILGSYSDGCLGLSHDTSKQTVTFTNVKLQGPGFGDVIVLNGTLKY